MIALSMRTPWKKARNHILVLGLLASNIKGGLDKNCVLIHNYLNRPFHCKIVNNMLYYTLSYKT